MKNVIIGTLVVLLVLLFVSFARLAHRNKDLRRWNDSLKAEVNTLKDELKKTGSNHTSEGIRQPADGLPKPSM